MPNVDFSQQRFSRRVFFQIHGEESVSGSPRVLENQIDRLNGAVDNRCVVDQRGVGRQPLDGQPLDR
jgi:hypothetical protein